MNIKCDTSGQRLDVFLAEAAGLSRSQAASLLEAGRCTMNGAVQKKNAKTQAGAFYELDLPQAEPVDILPQDIPLDVVYEDGDIIVINKPKGLVVHPAPGHPDGTLVNALLHHCGSSLSGINGEIRPGIVHRIDMDTSGLIVAAKNDHTHQALAEQLADHSLSRQYEAIVRGHMKTSTGTVDAPIGRSQNDRKKMAVTDKNSRSAVTHYEVLAEYPGYSHIRCQLETGRTHQIRVHMAYLGHPIVGDTVYGSKKPELGLDSQCLHARRLKLRHPTTGELMEFQSPLPDYFQQTLDKLENMR